VALCARGGRPRDRGQGLIVAGVGATPAALAGLLLLIQPVTGAMIAWPLFGEALTGIPLLAGCALVLIGVWLAAVDGRAPRQVRNQRDQDCRRANWRTTSMADQYAARSDGSEQPVNGIRVHHLRRCRPTHAFSDAFRECRAPSSPPTIQLSRRLELTGHQFNLMTTLAEYRADDRRRAGRQAWHGRLRAFRAIRPLADEGMICVERGPIVADVYSLSRFSAAPVSIARGLPGRACRKDSHRRAGLQPLDIHDERAPAHRAESRSQLLDAQACASPEESSTTTCRQSVSPDLA